MQFRENFGNVREEGEFERGRKYLIEEERI
jgi:hypothetical protein